MSIVTAYVSGNSVHNRVIEAFAEGAGALLLPFDRYRPGDVAIVFGVRKERVPVSWPRGEIIHRQREAGGRVLILETGYLRRGDGPGDHYAAGWNDLNGRADFRNLASPADRWEKLAMELKPWREKGEHVLVCGQVPWDASVQHHDHIGWCQSIMAKLMRLTKRPIVFRPHPKVPNVNYGVLGTRVSRETLADDLRDCHAVVTFNSNAAVEAAIAGVPVFAFDAGSMALPIANQDLGLIEEPVMPDRGQWLSDLAYCQWSLDEFRRGLAWQHLTR